MQELTQQVINNICSVNPNCSSEPCCDCIATNSPISTIESGRIEINTGTFIGCLVVDGIRYYDAEQICTAYGWTYDLTSVPATNMFKFELPNVITNIDTNGQPIKINIGKEMVYVNAQGLSVLCSNTLYNLELQSSDEAIEVNPLPFPPEPSEGSES